MTVRVAALGTGATSGTAVSTANSGGAAGTAFDSMTVGSGATVTWSNASGGVFDSMAMRITTTTATNAYARWDNAFRPDPGVPQVACLWMKFAANPSITTSVLLVANGSAQRILEVRVTSAGKARVTNSNGGTIVDTTTSIPLNQWFRVDVLYTPHATAGVVQMKMYTDPSSSTPTETTAVFTAQNFRQNDPSLFLLGVTNGATNLTMALQAFLSDGNPAPFGKGFVISRWVGGVTETGAGVAARVLGAASVRLKVSTTSDLAMSPVYSSSQVPDSNGTVRMSVSGLASDTQYYYGIEVDGAVDAEFNGTFRTAPAPGTVKSYKWAAASCARNNSNSAAFDTIRSHDPAFFVHLGDLHYRDITSNDPVAYERAYDQVMSSPRQVTFFGSMNVPYIWSDHDSTGPNGDSTAASLPAANTVLRSRVPGYANRPSVTGCYFSFTWGRVKFICTDSRSFRSPIAATDDASKTMLGSTQKAWLKSELSDPAYPVKVWCHEDAISNGATFTGDDTWSAYGTERLELVDFIRTNGVNVAYVCGDLHVLAADDGRNVPVAGASPAGFPVYVCSPLDNTSYVGNGTYSSGKYPTTDSTAPNYYFQFGLFTVTDTGSQIQLLYEGRDSTNAVRVSQTVTWQAVAEPEGWGVPIF